MPKPYTFPTLYNDVLQLNISKLKELGFLVPGLIKSGKIHWSSNGNPTGSISIQVNAHSDKPYIELDYKYRETIRKYKLDLISTFSNLNRGTIWYFLCPQTNKRCRKLYLVNGYFLHRTAFSGCMYETQIQSKKNRHFHKTLGVYFGLDNLYSELNKKHFKKYYSGKPTKKYLIVMEKIMKAERISLKEIEQAMVL